MALLKELYKGTNPIRFNRKFVKVPTSSATSATFIPINNIADYSSLLKKIDKQGNSQELKGSLAMTDTSNKFFDIALTRLDSAPTRLDSALLN